LNGRADGTPLRILHVTEAAGSGTLEVVSTLCAGLIAAGHDVAVATGERPETPTDLGAVLPAGVVLRRLPWTRRTPSQQLAAARALRRFAAEWSPDVVHLHSSFAGAVGALALGGRRTIYSPHAYSFARASEPAWRRAAYRSAERLIARRCGLVGAVSHAEAALARRGARASEVVAVPNGIPELDPGRAPEPAPDRGRRVVAMGRVGPQRRPAESAWILSQLAATASVAWIGGAPAGEDAPLRAAGVPVTGWLPRSEALAALAQAQVYLHWSAWDGQSLSILEALARDVVVIASDIPANREIVGDRQVVGTPEAALQLARAVLDDAELRASLLASQRAARPRWGAARMIEEWIATYGRLADGTASAANPPNIGAPWN
jgi:glycosyltransferase involved in cell wall biosynthesis